MAKKTNNAILQRARNNVNDEFYTLYKDVAKECETYATQFKDKIIYMNCDNIQWSNFWRYFRDNFERLQLKEIIATNAGSKLITRYDIMNGIRQQEMKYLGLYQNKECLDLMEQADIIVTNPPFSLLRNFIFEIFNRNKKLLIVAPLSIVSHDLLFKRIVNGDIRIGNTTMNNFATSIADIVEEQSNKSVFALWVTNLETLQKKDIKLTKDYDPAIHKKYSNMNAINCDYFNDIPINYNGLIGVPISILPKWNHLQFELVSIFRPRMDGVEMFSRVLLRHGRHKFKNEKLEKNVQIRLI